MALLDDVKSFLDLESRAWYSVHGIPYRRGYLLYGPPRTGKSSLSLSIAGGYDLDLYILNHSSVDEDSLRDLCTKLPARCVVLLEDIDAVNATYSRQRGTVTPGQDDTDSSTKKNSEGKVSPSALLNAIDGVSSQQGRLLIMTTNHIERLDGALIRPGRVDIKLELGLTTHDINAQLFFSIFRTNVSAQKEKAEKAEGVLNLKKLEAEAETELKELAADFASKVPEYEFSPAEIQLFLLGYRKSPAIAVQNVQEWVVRAREEKGHIKRADPWVSEGFRSGNDITPTVSATTQDGAQSREMASAIAPMETPITTTDSHCCACQVEQSLLCNYLSDLEVYRSTHADRPHSTVEFLNLLLDFVKKIYTSSTERHPRLSAASSGSPSLPLASASNDLLTLLQPATKIVENLELKLVKAQLSALAKEPRIGMTHELEDEKAHCSGGNTAVSDLQKFWDKEGWEPIFFDFNNATPDLSYYLHPLDDTYSDAAFSETSPDDSSSGTSFESGSEMSCEVESIVEQADVTEDSPGLEANCQFDRQPATPPASPITSTPVLLSGNQEKEMPCSIADLRRALENALKYARLADGQHLRYHSPFGE